MFQKPFFILSLTILSLLQGCNSQKVKANIQNCPSNGSCTIEFLENTVAQMEADKYGKTYVNLKSVIGTTTLLVTYKDDESDLSDSSYSEEFYLPLSKISKHGESGIFELTVIYGRIGNFRNQKLYFIDDNALLRLKSVQGKRNLEVSVNPAVPMKMENLVLTLSNLQTSGSE